MDKISRKIISVFCLGSLVLMVLIILASADSLISRDKEYIYSTIVDIQNTLESNYITDNLAKMQREGVEKAKTVDLMIDLEGDNFTEEKLHKIRNIAGVQEIYIIDENNVVVMSTSSDAVGAKILGQKDQIGDNSDYYKVYREKSVENELESSTLIHIVFPLQIDSSPNLKVDVLISNWEKANRIEETQEVFENFPSASYTIYAVVMKDTGDTIALSKNNIQEVSVDHGLKGDDYLQLLKKITEGEKNFVMINGSLRLAQAIEADDYFIVAYRDYSGLRQTLIQETRVIMIYIVICGVTILTACSKVIEKYIFRDLEMVNLVIEKLLLGDYTADFQEPQIRELYPLIDAMQKLKEIFFHKAERMDRILDAIGLDIGVFECLNNTELNFYSKSLWEVLQLKETEVEAFLNKTENFKTFMDSLLANRSESNIVVYRDRHLEVYAYNIGEGYSGVVIDRTKEELKKINLEKSLTEAKKSGMQDSLTQVRNRTGFQNEVGRLISENENQGILLIFDLDNFKRINDSLGHPEGDKVLTLFSKCMKHQFRKSDVVGRLGGDEFVVFIPNKIEKNILQVKLDSVMKETREAFEKYQKYGLGVSIGVGKIDAEKGITDYSALYECADSALYVAKQMGKNQYFINFDGVRCMQSTCTHCRRNCPRREALEKIEKLKNGQS